MLRTQRRSAGVVTFDPVSGTYLGRNGRRHYCR
uniref:Lectin-like protein BA14k n=1 Tax=Bradyrhizobium quebecense TaxID=2748629 RepID=A0A973WKN3_9BRAD